MSEPDNLPAVRQEAAYPEIRREHTDDWIAVVKPVAELAEQVANTEFVPAGLRGKPAAITAALLFGRELNIAPMHALAGIHMVEGKPTLAAEELRAMVLAAGHEIGYGEVSSARCAVKGRRTGSTEWTVVIWTIADAQNAGLTGKSNWKKYPRQMLVARATAELCRMIFADVTHGVHATEELEDGGDAGPGMGGQAPANAKVQRKSRTSKTDDGAASGAATPTAGAGAPAAPSSLVPPLPGEPGFDGPGVGVAAAAQSADGVSRVPAAPASTPQSDDGAGAPPAVGGDPAGEATSTPAPSSLPLEGDLPPEVEQEDRPRMITRAMQKGMFATFNTLGITDDSERLHITEAIIGRTPMHAGKPSSHGLTAAEAQLLIDALGRCKSRDHVEALVQLAEQERAQGGEQDA